MTGEHLPLIEPILQLVQSGHADSSPFDTNETIGLRCPQCHREKRLHRKTIAGMLGCHVKCGTCGLRSLVPVDLPIEAPACGT